MFKKSKLGSVAAGIAACLQCAAHADEAPASLRKITVDAAEEPAPYTVDETASATKLQLSLRDTPQSVTVITRERLDDQNLQSLREVLDQTPGIYSYAYDTERVLFTSRGFTVDNLLFDGVPAAANSNTDSVDETLDTALYERIEVVRGATGLMTGAGSPAAAVNLVRKHANSEDLQMQFDVTAGSWSDGRIEADVSTPLNDDGSVRARFVGVYQERESYQKLYENTKKVFYGVVDADAGSNTRLSLGFDYQENDPRGNTWGSFPLFLGDGTLANWSRAVTTATDWSHWNRTKKTVFGELDHGFDNGWSLRATVSWRRYDESMALFYMFGFPDPVTGTGLDPYAYRSTADVKEKALDVYASGPFEWLGRQHELVIGYNGSRTDYAGVEFEPGDYADPGNFFAWDGSYPQPDFAAAPTLVTDTHIRQHGFYSAARFSVADPVKLIAGARFSIYEADYYNLYDSPENGFDYDHKKALPYAGVVYDFSGDFSVFASFTEIFKPQNAKDVLGRLLDPVDGRSFEVGLKGEHFDGRFNTALTLFETRQDNVAVAAFDPDTGEAILLPDGTEASQAIDGTKTRGFEFEASGQLREGWNASIGWTRYQLEDANGDDVRAFIPRTLIRAFTTWHAPAGIQALTVGGGLDWQSSSTTIVSAPDGAAVFRQGSVTLIGLMARYQFTERAAVQVNLENALDKKYYVLDDFDNTYYGAPLSGSVSFNWTF